MAIRTELSLRLPNNPGALAGVCRLLSSERVNVVAMALDAGGQLHMVVDNHVHGAAVLREHHHQVAERDVLVTTVPHSAGSLASMLRLIAEAGVNIDYLYGGAAETSSSATIVLGVEHPLNASAAAGI
jgi:hypothetical protein